MNWNPSTLWWLVAGVLVAAELATGTFYMLMVALGCAAGAIAAHAGLGQTVQLALAAVVGAGATLGWHLKRRSAPAAAPAASNRDVNLDIGQQLQVDAWGSDGSARVQYRGAAWTARLAGSGAATPGRYVIVALVGSELRLAPAPRP